MIWLLGAALLGGVWYGLRRRARQVVFRPVRGLLPLDLPFESFFLPSGREKIHVLYLPAQKTKDTLLFFHGNGGNVTHFAPFAARYAAHGLGVMLFDYRGFGQSTGRASEKNTFQDGQAALDYLLNIKKIPAQKIVLWGYSLGNAPALAVAARNAHVPFKAVILQSPFTSAAEMGAFRADGYYTPWSFKQRLVLLLLQLLLFNLKMDNTRRIALVKAPLLVAYSKKDETVPWRMSAALARRAPQGAQVYASDTGAHGEYAWLEKSALEFLQMCR